MKTTLLAIFTLAISSSSIWAKDYQGGKVAGYGRPAMALRAQVPGIVRARTMHPTADNVHQLVAAQMTSGEVHVFKVNRTDGTVIDMGNVVPKAKQRVAFDEKVKRGRDGFKVGVGDGTGNGLPTLSHSGLSVRLNISKPGTTTQNRIINTPTGRYTVVTADPADGLPSNR